MGLWADTRRRFGRNRLALFGLLVLLLIALAAVFAPHLVRYGYNQLDLAHMDAAPGYPHWLGTDDLGRDELTRILYAGRVSLTIGLLAAAAAALVGSAIGATAGYYGGWTDSLLMRFTDLALSVPPLPLIIVLSAVLKPSTGLLIMLIAGVGWMGTARLVRGVFLTIRQEDYVEAARAVGASHIRIIVRHALPNAMAPVIVATTLAVGNAIISESVLSFLGVGVRPPTPSWGNMLQAAQTTMATKPWLSIFPGVFILLSVLSVNALGDGLRDALDVRMKT